MKRFTKICLSIVLITFLIGCLLGCVGTLLGGLRQLEHVSVERLTGIPFRFVRNGSSAFFGFWNDDWDDDWDEFWDESWDWDSSEWEPVEPVEALEEMERMKDSSTESDKNSKDNAASQKQAGLQDKDTQADGNMADIAGGMETGLTAAGLRKLNLEVGACQMYIGEASDDQLSIAITGECENHYRYRIKDGNTFILVHKDMRSNIIDDIWNGNHPKGNTKIMLYLPKDAVLDDINIDFGAGKLEAGYLKAKEIEINVGAGECIFDGLEASESVEITLGAGKLVTEELTAAEADFSMAAGELQINGAKVGRETKVDISMGNASLIGMFAGELDVECSMGRLDFVLEGTESDYDYEIDCGMGSINIGNKAYNGLADHEIRNGSNNKIDISCSMGDVNVSFTK